MLASNNPTDMPTMKYGWNTVAVSITIFYRGWWSVFQCYPAYPLCGKVNGGVRSRKLAQSLQNDSTGYGPTHYVAGCEWPDRICGESDPALT